MSDSVFDTVEALDRIQNEFVGEYAATYVDVHRSQFGIEIELHFRGFQTLQAAMDRTSDVALDLATRSGVRDVDQEVTTNPGHEHREPVPETRPCGSVTVHLSDPLLDDEASEQGGDDGGE